jgi:hypothetical protein
MLTVISEARYDIDTEAIGQVVGGARVEDGVVDEDVDDGVEELDDGDVEVDSVTTQTMRSRVWRLMTSKLWQMRRGRDGIASSQAQAAKRSGSNWTAN